MRYIGCQVRALAPSDLHLGCSQPTSSSRVPGNRGAESQRHCGRRAEDARTQYPARRLVNVLYRLKLKIPPVGLFVLPDVFVPIAKSACIWYQRERLRHPRIPTHQSSGCSLMNVRIRSSHSALSTLITSMPCLRRCSSPP